MAMQRPSSMFCLCLVAVVGILLVSKAESQNSSISCSDVIKEIAPCASYLRENTGGGGKPSAACCNGVKEVKDEAKSREDQIAICNCIKQGLAQIGNYDPQRIPQLPKDCHLNFNLPPIDKNTDCKVAMTMMTV